MEDEVITKGQSVVKSPSGKRAGFDGKPESMPAFTIADEGVQEVEASAHLLEVAGCGSRWGSKIPQ